MNRKVISAALIIMCVMGIYPLYSWWYIPWRYLTPFRAMVEKRASESESINTIHYRHGARNGKPDITIGDNDIVRRLAKAHRVAPAPSRVLMYYADPWENQDGFFVYLYFDTSGRAVRVKLGPNLLTKEDNIRIRSRLKEGD